MIKTKILPLLVMAVGLWLAFYGGRETYLAFASARWPTVHGAVVSSDIETMRARRGSTYQPKVVFHYAVQGHDYTSDTLTFAGLPGDANTAREYTHRFPRGADVTVHYDPGDPSVACLVCEGPGWRDWVTLLAGLAIAGVAGMGLYGGLREQRPRTPRGRMKVSGAA